MFYMQGTKTPDQKSGSQVVQVSFHKRHDMKLELNLPGNCSGMGWIMERPVFNQHVKNTKYKEDTY